MKKNLVLTLSTAIVLTVIYSVAIPRIFPRGGVAESMAQENELRIQEFLYRETMPRIVIVGSSKAARLDGTWLPSDMANIAMAGEGPGFGLTLMLASTRKPELVLVEVNDTILRPVRDFEAIERRYQPLRHWMMTHWRALQLRYQPSVILNGLLSGKAKVESVPTEDSAPAAYPELLNIELASGNEMPNEQAVHDSAADLREAIVKFQTHNIRVVLFDPPAAPEAEATQRAKLFRELLAKEFPKEQYEWLPRENPADYQTSDGLHLMPASAHRYLEKIRQSLATNR